MHTRNILVSNLLRYMDEFNYKEYASFAAFLGINESTLKCWVSEKRNPNLDTVDNIANVMGLPTYYLLIPEVEFKCKLSEKHIYLPNDSRPILSNNLRRIYFEKNRITWNQRASLFYGYFSIDTLMSYTRENSYRTPPLKKISLMAECLGIEPYKLLKKGE